MGPIDKTTKQIARQIALGYWEAEVLQNGGNNIVKDVSHIINIFHLAKISLHR